MWHFSHTHHQLEGYTNIPHSRFHSYQAISKLRCTGISHSWLSYNFDATFPRQHGKRPDASKALYKCTDRRGIAGAVQAPGGIIPHRSAAISNYRAIVCERARARPVTITNLLWALGGRKDYDVWGISVERLVLSAVLFFCFVLFCAPFASFHEWFIRAVVSIFQPLIPCWRVWYTFCHLVPCVSLRCGAHVEKWCLWGEALPLPAGQPVINRLANLSMFNTVNYGAVELGTTRGHHAVR